MTMRTQRAQKIHEPEMTARDWFAPRRLPHWWLLCTSTIMAIAMATWAGFTVWSAVTAPSGPFIALAGPAYDFPQAIVETTVEPGGTLHVINVTKCNISGSTVDIHGIIQWARVDVRGASIPIFNGSTAREPGCKTQNYENPVPLEIGPAGSVWELQGTETAVDRNTGETHIRTWQTTPVTIVGG